VQFQCGLAQQPGQPFLRQLSGFGLGRDVIQKGRGALRRLSLPLDANLSGTPLQAHPTSTFDGTKVLVQWPAHPQQGGAVFVWQVVLKNQVGTTGWFGPDCRRLPFGAPMARNSAARIRRNS
jgi:hypothetical protein